MVCCIKIRMDYRELPSPILNRDSDALAALRDEADGYVTASTAPTTRKAYASDWADFVAWCNQHALASLPATPNTVALYLTQRARSLKTSTLERRLVSIGHSHRHSHLENPATDPAVRAVWDGIRREKGSAKARKNPALTKLIRKMIAALPATNLGARDRALLLLGYAGALRRSELVNLAVSDLELADEGLIITLRKSKTDQNARGRRIGIPFGNYEETCPVRAVRNWLDVSGITEGALFRAVNRHGQVQPGQLGDKPVATVVKRSLTAAGFDPKNFAGHSLRSGFATMAALAGSSERDIQKQTGHKNLLVLRRYIHDGQLFQNNAARKLGL